MSSLLLLLAVSEAHLWLTAESRGMAMAKSSAQGLGFDLQAFDGPKISGNHLFGTETFVWEAGAADDTLNRLTLLVYDVRHCWSTVRTGEFKDHGCVVARASFQ
jgi:hypothetical protein